MTRAEEIRAAERQVIAAAERTRDAFIGGLSELCDAVDALRAIREPRNIYAEVSYWIEAARRRFPDSNVVECLERLELLLRDIQDENSRKAPAR